MRNENANLSEDSKNLIPVLIGHNLLGTVVTPHETPYFSRNIVPLILLIFYFCLVSPKLLEFFLGTL